MLDYISFGTLDVRCMGQLATTLIDRVGAATGLQADLHDPMPAQRTAL